MKPFGIIAVLLLVAGTCQADAILSNLPGSGSYTGDSAPLSGIQWVAVGLETGSAEEFTQLEGFFSSATNATLGGWIYTDSSGHPGTVVGTFNSVSLAAGGPTELTFTTNTMIDLQAATKYWFVIEDATGVAWKSDNSNSSAGTAPVAADGAIFQGYQTTSNSGSTWTTLSAGNPTIEIDVAPEPASIFLLLGGAAFVVARRTRQARV